MSLCPYREKETECRQNPGCDTCLLGQIADNTDLLITAIGNLTTIIEKGLCREEQK